MKNGATVVFVVIEESEMNTYDENFLTTTGS